MAKNKGGRPTVMTPETINKLEEVFSIGGSDGEACFFANISHQTLYDYQKKHPEFIERKAALKKDPTLKARREVVKGLEGNAEFSLKYLERKRSDEFSLKQKIEHEGEVKIVKNDKELDAMADKVEEGLKDKKMKDETQS